MALPKAAQKQLERAEKIHAEAYADGDRSNEEAEAGQDQASAGLREVPSKAPQDAQSSDSGSEESSPAPESTSEAPTTVEDEGNWEHKYKVLQGKYNAEVPRLQQSVDAANGRVAEMESQMAALAAQMAENNTVPIEPASHLTAEEIADYGDDMIAVVKKAAREEFEPQVASLQSENAQLRNLLGGMQQQTALSARDSMLQALDNEASIGNWREINGHPDFLAWLENVDAYAGQKKLDMLRQAFESNNTSRVMSFFKGFLNENAAYTPTPTPSTAEPQVNLDTLVAPGRATEGGENRAQDGAPSGRVWSGADISEFYRDVNRGVYRDKPEERARLEADLFLAQDQGRIAQ